MGHISEDQFRDQVVVPWLREQHPEAPLLRRSTSFEDGPGDWATSSNGETTWELDAEGPNSSTAWHAGTHTAHVHGIPVVEEF
jgi:hypothetical protein